MKSLKKVASLTILDCLKSQKIMEMRPELGSIIKTLMEDVDPRGASNSRDGLVKTV